MCSVFVALKINQIEAYITWLQKQRYSVNYSKLANVDMPKGSGKKSSSHQKVSQKQSMKQVKQLLQESSGECTYQVEPSYISINVASQSFDNEGSSQHMTEKICDTPSTALLFLLHLHYWS